MAKCSACGKFISSSGGASCTTCTSVYHRGCVAIPDTAAIPKDWVCPDCNKKVRKGDNSSTPVKNVCYGPSTSAAATVTVTGSHNSQELEIGAMRRELASSLSEFRDLMREFRSSMKSMELRFNSFEQRLETVERKQAEVPPVGGDVVELRRTVEGLKAELNARDQDMLLSDLDIGHLPEEKGVSPLHTVTVLAAKLGVTLASSDIVFAERVGAPVPARDGAEARPRRVVVRLVRRELRDELLRAARVRRGITSADVGGAGPPRRIYLNERLTATNRHLFHRVREECLKRRWRYSWTKKGRIFAREDDGKQVHSFRSDSDVDRVFGMGDTKSGS